MTGADQHRNVVSNDRRLRVVVWATGGIGSLAIQAVNRRPDLELVGVWVHTPDKVGRDAGELGGGSADGIGRRPTTPRR